MRVVPTAMEVVVSTAKLGQQVAESATSPQYFGSNLGGVHSGEPRVWKRKANGLQDTQLDTKIIAQKNYIAILRGSRCNTCENICWPDDSGTPEEKPCRGFRGIHRRSAGKVICRYELAWSFAGMRYASCVENRNADLAFLPEKETRPEIFGMFEVDSNKDSISCSYGSMAAEPQSLSQKLQPFPRNC